MSGSCTLSLTQTCQTRALSKHPSLCCQAQEPRRAAEGSQLWPHVSELPYTPYICVCVWCVWSRGWILSRTRPFPGVAFTEAESRQHVAGMFLSFLRVEEILRGEKCKWNIFHARVLARLPARREKKRRDLYTLIRSVTKITSRKLFK